MGAQASLSPMLAGLPTIPGLWKAEMEFMASFMYARQALYQLSNIPNPIFYILNSRVLKMRSRMILQLCNTSNWEVETGEPGIQGHL